MNPPYPPFSLSVTRLYCHIILSHSYILPYYCAVSKKWHKVVVRSTWALQVTSLGLEYAANKARIQFIFIMNKHQGPKFRGEVFIKAGEEERIPQQHLESSITFTILVDVF